MDDDYTREAKRLRKEHGAGTARFIAMRIADANRGGDPEMIDHWRAVMKALEGLAR